MLKRGQFYFVATIIIIGVIIGLATTYNSARVKKDAQLLNLPKEMKKEINKVLENAAFRNLPNSEVNNNIEEITDYYASSNKEKYFLVVYGDNQELTVISYNNPQSGAPLIIHQGVIDFSQPSQFKTNETIPRQGNEIAITFQDSATHSFTLNQGRTIFSLLKQEKDGEVFIATSDDS